VVEQIVGAVPKEQITKALERHFRTGTGYTSRTQRVIRVRARWELTEVEFSKGVPSWHALFL